MTTATVAATQGVGEIALSGPLVVALLIAVAAGAVSFFSPCCLPLVPGYLSYVAGIAGSDSAHRRSDASHDPAPDDGGREVAVKIHTRRRSAHRSRTLLGAVLFVAGFSALFTSYGALFGSFGSLLMTYQDTLVRILGVFTILLGLMFTGLFWRIPLAGRTFRPAYRPRAGLAGALLARGALRAGLDPLHRPDPGCGAHLVDELRRRRPRRAAHLRLQRRARHPLHPGRLVGHQGHVDLLLGQAPRSGGDVDRWRDVGPARRAAGDRPVDAVDQPPPGSHRKLAGPPVTADGDLLTAGGRAWCCTTSAPGVAVRRPGRSPSSWQRPDRTLHPDPAGSGEG